MTRYYTIWIVIPTDNDGWEGSAHLPTYLVLAFSRDEAEAKAQNLVDHLPIGTTFTIGEYS